MQAKLEGRQQKARNDSEEIYGFEYKLDNAKSLLRGARNISSHDKNKIWEFLELLKALRVSKGRIAKYILHLKMIGENIGIPFEEANRRRLEHVLADWLYSQNYSAETTADYAMVLKRFYKFLRFGNVDKETPFPEEVRWLKKTINQTEERNQSFSLQRR
jgi:hypothetical protein